MTIFRDREALPRRWRLSLTVSRLGYGEPLGYRWPFERGGRGSGRLVPTRAERRRRDRDHGLGALTLYQHVAGDLIHEQHADA